MSSQDALDRVSKRFGKEQKREYAIAKQLEEEKAPDTVNRGAMAYRLKVRQERKRLGLE